MKTAVQTPASDYKRLTDEELLYRYVHRHENVAVNYLFDRYAHLVFGICMKHFADATKATEATNDIFISLVDDLGKYNIEQFKPWFFQYVKKYSMLKANNSIQVADNKVVLDTNMEFDNQPMPDAVVTISLEKEIRSLANDERACMEMFYLKNMNYEQIAMKTNRSQIEVKHLLQEGKKHLKEKVAHV